MMLRYYPIRLLNITRFSINIYFTFKIVQHTAAERQVKQFAYKDNDLTQDVNKSGKIFQMRKIGFFSLLAHKNLKYNMMKTGECSKEQ